MLSGCVVICGAIVVFLWTKAGFFVNEVKVSNSSNLAAWLDLLWVISNLIPCSSYKSVNVPKQVLQEDNNHQVQNVLQVCEKTLIYRQFPNKHVI